jgi:uncharacterized protein
MRPWAPLLGLALTSCSSLLYHPSHELHFDPVKLFGRKPEEVHFASADGTKLFGWRFRTANPKAVFILYHGNAQNLSSHYVTMMWAPQRDFDLFVFDYRGYGRSEGKPSPEGTAKDGEAALRWLHGQYPKVPIVIVGQSLGGAIALRNAIDLKGEIPFRAVVIEGSFPSYRGVAADVLSRSWITWPVQWLGYLVMSDAFAPDGEIQKIAPVPLLVMHSEGDRTVPIRFGERIFAQAGEPKDFWRIPGLGHTDGFLQQGGAYARKLEEWLRDRGVIR